MKKIIIAIIATLSLLSTGCFGKKNNLNEFLKNTKKMKGYYLTGTLEIINNEDIYTYDVKASYKDKDYYKVSLTNKTNDHEQIILKNDDGVYVLTPSLNKSFKFQSEWPYNNSQSYLLQSIVNDMENDKNKKVENKGKKTIITTKANYTNNPKLKTQKIYLEESIPTKVEVYDNDGNIKIKMKFNDIDLKPKFDKEYFEVKTNVSSKIVETSKQLEDIIYPMNMPKNTYLASEDKVSITDGERVILTFLGDKPFTLIEETVNVSKELETVDMYGEPELLIDTVGALSDNSVTWISDGVEYYATSSVMKEEELLDVIKSISVMPVSK
jgi:outer membrane lipoprotein-sorting protein